MKPHAEVGQVWPENGRVLVLGSFHGLAAGERTWQVTLVLREPRGPELAYPVTVSGQAFEASVPIADLVPSEAPEKGVWDLYLSADGTRLRVGRHLDDIRDKTSIMVFPAQLIPLDGGFMHVRPRYTVNENLSIDYWYGT
ncbi:hypothetical protein Misp01_15250 [Microtetraspora sp. NBRC 13810]|uniref:hypothetical protein n=1 Tax=Microtetraspora sp. NBRC 13810 TaxID=3030990 RepID=UPI0024A5A28E|nr:hypothetical protein [Microtetraspora sp. NBRC 13810]GLW06395.1 hypothetical protein Misp01_15250 [Microtetraspora sp. NBRC 13810]